MSFLTIIIFAGLVLIVLLAGRYKLVSMRKETNITRIIQRIKA